MFYTIIGTQWGDEGKGKIVDWLASKVNTVVRFQGGNNAGHTIKIKNKTYKLNLLPSGIIRGKKCIIGNGVVLDPWALNDEIIKLRKQGIYINSKNLMIAENVCLILPIHKLIDSMNEEVRGSEPIGTTKKGIGPSYEDKVGRRSIRLCDIKNRKILSKKILNLIDFHNYRFKNFKKRVDKKKLLNDLTSVYRKLNKYSQPTWRIINQIAKERKKILFEGAQGALLDIDFGTYPYVTSSNTNSGQIFAGTGFGSRKNHQIFGITKAYTTRVGSGPFPTELKDKVGDYLGEKGKEFGTVTNRKRRCGWFDACLVKQSVNINGVDDIVLTKIDVLDELENIKVCVGYKINKKRYDYLPFSEESQKSIIPIYKIFKGWQESTYGIKEWSKLPSNAKKYIKSIEKIIGVNISIISTGPDRNHTIDKKKYLKSI
tara:strand:- start:5080 stop:6366 length:1287 start_codon:yes stop_codon:yes gene_type:complete